MNFEDLNKMSNYIENNLDKEINPKKLSQIIKTNYFILDRIFMFLTDMTIAEYIKKRRLSKAFEEIRNTKEKITDIAFKYQYNSASSFDRAFKQQFGITPKECRKGIGNYKIVPIEYFETHSSKYDFDYQIKKIDTTIIYCYHITSKHHSDLLYKIRKLYQKSRTDGKYAKFGETGMYGIYSQDRGIYHYYLGSTKFFPDLEKYEIAKKKYVEFKLTSREQEEIIKFEDKINKQWIPSTNYNIKEVTKIELYKNTDCYIYLPIE